MHLLYRNPLLWGTALCFATGLLRAQHNTMRTGQVEVAVTYAAQRGNAVGGDPFWLQGGAAQLSAPVYRGLGITMDIAGSHASNVNGSGLGLNLLTTTFGPRYTLQGRRVAFFGEGLVGEAHGWNALFPAAGGATRSSRTLALQVGGGMDFRAGRHLAVRVVQADWVRTQFPNSTNNVQNSLRLGAGLIFRFR